MPTTQQPATTPYIKGDFSGGMDLFTERTKLDESKYPLLINGRSRFGRITPVKKPKKVFAGLPIASNENNVKYQGLYSAGNFAVVFVSGYAYLRDFSSNENFIRIPEFQMSPLAEQFYLELVPASTINYKRVATDEDDVTAEITLLSELVSPSPIAAVVQDGVSQPWVILSNGQARKTQTFDQWQNNATNREYVPIGKQMVHAGDKLYITDGKQIFQSVSGRPLDFIVAIDENGNKVGNEEEGGAKNTSHRVFYDDITCLGKISTTEESDGSFYVGSPRNSFIVVPDFNNTIYNEPQFDNRYVTNTGALNQFSFLGDVDGDSVFIDGNSIKSFNSILQFKNTGRNSPFSLAISSLFTGIKFQSVTAAGQFDNYSVFAVKTVYGPALVWYDDLRNVWEAIDILEDVTGSVRQFSEILLPTGEKKLLFLTTNNELYEAFGSDEVATCKLYIGDWSAQDPSIEQKLGNIKAVFNQPQSDGMINATLFVDNKLQFKLSKPITESYEQDEDGTIEVPFGNSDEKSTPSVNFDFSRSNIGFKFGVMFEWSILADLLYVSGTSISFGNITNSSQANGQDFVTLRNHLKSRNAPCSDS